MRGGRRKLAALVLVGAALALGAAGCGDDEDSPEVTIPTISTEDSTDTTTSESTTESTESTETESGDDSGGTGGSFDPNQEDSETNDKPPPAGSPQEAFEKQCEQNPAACG